jgi:Ca2+-dependent lipid-binding protein
MDELDESDPYCKFSTRNSPDEAWESQGKTETVDNNLSPQWVNHFNILYEFHKPIYLKFEVLDEDNGGDEILGTCECMLSNILTAPKWEFSSVLVENGKHMGILHVSADVVQSSNDEITFQFKGKLIS